MTSKVENENVKQSKPKRVYGCRPYILQYKTGNEIRDDIYGGEIVIYAHKRADVDTFLEKHPVDAEHNVQECESKITKPYVDGRDHHFHGIRVGMFFLDKEANVESPDEMSERKFNFLYNNLPDGCGTFDCENLYHKMFEEDYMNDDEIVQLEEL